MPAMKHVKLDLDDDLLKAAEAYAAKYDTTVDAILRDYLARIVTQSDRAAQARKELVELAKKSTLDLGPGWKWNREELYDRSVLSGHKRSDLRGSRS